MIGKTYIKFVDASKHLAIDNKPIISTKYQSSELQVYTIIVLSKRDVHCTLYNEIILLWKVGESVVIIIIRQS